MDKKVNVLFIENIIIMKIITVRISVVIVAINLDKNSLIIDKSLILEITSPVVLFL